MLIRPKTSFLFPNSILIWNLGLFFGAVTSYASFTVRERVQLSVFLNFHLAFRPQVACICIYNVHTNCFEPNTNSIVVALIFGYLQCNCGKTKTKQHLVLVIFHLRQSAAESWGNACGLRKMKAPLQMLILDQKKKIKWEDQQNPLWQMIFFFLEFIPNGIKRENTSKGPYNLCKILVYLILRNATE